MEKSIQIVNSIYKAKAHNKTISLGKSYNIKNIRSLSIQKLMPPSKIKNLKRKTQILIPKSNNEYIPLIAFQDQSIESEEHSDYKKNKAYADVLLNQLKSHLSNTQLKQSETLSIYLQTFEELINYLKPFNELLNMLKSGITNYYKDYINDLLSNKQIIELSRKNHELKKKIEIMDKEKHSLIKKLNAAEDQIEKLVKEYADFKENFLNINKRLKIKNEILLDPEQVYETMLKQASLIQEHETTIKRMLINEIKLKKIIDYVISKGIDMEKIINDVNIDFQDTTKAKSLADNEKNISVTFL